LLTDGLRISRLAMAYDCYGSVEAYEHHVGDIVREHRALVMAIAAGDAASAGKLADSHSNLARKRVTAYLGRQSTHDIPVELAGAAQAAVVA
jgi:DNA-binding GntR family transcriptional regulator